MDQDYCIMMAVYGSRMSMISIYRFLLNNHDHPVSGHFSQNKTLELVRRDYTWPGIRMSLKTIVSHVRLAPGLKRHAIGRTDFFDNSRSRRNHGIQFQSILLISYHLPQAIHQYW